MHSCAHTLSFHVLNNLFKMNLSFPESRKIQELVRRYSQRIINDNQKLSSELESKKHDLDSVSKHLDELARNYEQEKNEVTCFSNYRCCEAYLCLCLSVIPY